MRYTPLRPASTRGVRPYARRPRGGYAPTPGVQPGVHWRRGVHAGRTWAYMGVHGRGVHWRTLAYIGVHTPCHPSFSKNVRLVQEVECGWEVHTQVRSNLNQCLCLSVASSIIHGMSGNVPATNSSQLHDVAEAFGTALTAAVPQQLHETLGLVPNETIVSEVFQHLLGHESGFDSYAFIIVADKGPNGPYVEAWVGDCYSTLVENEGQFKCIYAAYSQCVSALNPIALQFLSLLFS